MNRPFDSIPIIVLLVVSLFGCNGGDVSRPEDINDHDAIYHSIIYDMASKFNLDLLDFSIPDTLPIAMAPVVPDFHWFVLDSTLFDIDMNIEYPQAVPDTVLPIATVLEEKKFYGTFEIMGTDTTGGQSIPVRWSKSFIITGRINAEFRKFGSDLNYRRGWLITRISDAVYVAGYPQGITQIAIQSDSLNNFIVVSAIRNISSVLSFSPGESISVVVNVTDPQDIARIRFPVGSGYQNITLSNNQGGAKTGSFNLPETTGYYHFLVEVINRDVFGENGSYSSDEVGVLFNIE